MGHFDPTGGGGGGGGAQAKVLLWRSNFIMHFNWNCELIVILHMRNMA